MNVAVASVVVEWLETASPISAVAGSVIVAVPTGDQLAPSADWYAEIVAPVRVSFTQYGAVTSAPAVLVDVPPATSRRWKLLPFPGVTIIIACGDPGVRSPRIITPALTQTLVFWTDTTRATIWPSPASG